MATRVDETAPALPEEREASSATSSTVRVGVGVIVRRPDGRFLLGERHGSFGVGKVAFPGGHLELGESWDACARREVMEETGISLAEPTRHVATTNDVMVDDGKHYVTIFMLAEAPEAQRGVDDLVADLTVPFADVLLAKARSAEMQG